MKHFSELTSDQRIEAILAAIEDPIPKEFVLDLAGVNVDKLNQDTAQLVNQIFERWEQLPTSEASGNATYRIPATEQQETLERIEVDTQSVYERIADVFMRELGLKE